jgi:hypothetical protein
MMILISNQIIIEFPPISEENNEVYVRCTCENCTAQWRCKTYRMIKELHKIRPHKHTTYQVNLVDPKLNMAPFKERWKEWVI